MGANGLNTPAPINYETALPQGVGKLVQQEDGSMVLANEHEQGFMVNQAIVDFWKSCNGQRKVTDLVEFANQTGLRNQVEKEVMQIKLRDGGLQRNQMLKKNCLGLLLILLFLFFSTIQRDESSLILKYFGLIWTIS